jgi:hypothetical protein
MLDVELQIPDKKQAQAAVTQRGYKANIQVAFKCLPTNRVNNMVCAL